MVTGNDNEAARPYGERGISVVHRKDAKQQRAAKAGTVYDEGIPYHPTLRELAFLYGVSVSLVNQARQLSVEKRQAVAEGHAKLPPLNPPNRQLALPLPEPRVNGKPTDDTALFDMIAAAGIEKTLAVAAIVEQAQQH